MISAKSSRSNRCEGSRVPRTRTDARVFVRIEWAAVAPRIRGDQRTKAPSLPLANRHRVLPMFPVCFVTHVAGRTEVEAAAVLGSPDQSGAELLTRRFR